MADVKYTVTVDSTGAVKSIELLDAAWQKVEKQAGPTKTVTGELGKALQTVAGQFTIATLAARAIQGAISGVKEFFSSAIEGAMEEESSQLRLKTALEMSRTARVSGLRDLKGFAQEQAKVTVYTDDQIRATMTLLASMTELDNEGLKRMTRGVIGLSSVLGPNEGLEGATMRVMRALEGNAAGLKRVGIDIDSTLPKGEQLLQLQEKLAALYPRATAELATTGGQVKNLKKEWGELKEELGAFILEGVNADNNIKSLTNTLRGMREAGIKTAETLDYARVKHEMFAAGMGTWKGGGELPMEKVLKVLQRDLPEIHTSYKALMETWLKGPDAFNKFIQTLIATNDILAQGRDAFKEGTKGAFDLTQAFKDLGIKSETELAAKLKLAKDALTAYTATGKPTTGVVEDLQKKIDELTKALEGSDYALKRIGKTIPLLKTDLKTGEQMFKEMSDAALEAMTIELPEIDFSEMFKVPEDIQVPPFIQATIDALGDMGHAAQIQAGKLEAEWRGLTKVGLESKLVALRTELDRMTKSGDYTEKQMAEVRKEIRRTEEELRDTPKAVLKLRDAFTSMLPYVQTVFSGLNAIFSQAQQNREIAIENEYKKRLKFIEATISDEDAKQKAIMALEAEFEIKRTSAKAAAAKQAKAVALAEAIWNTARAVTEALPNFILAAIVGAMGAVQIAMIAKQPIPLAKGAVFTKPTILSTSEGQTLQVGEAGIEYLVPEKHLAPMVRDYDSAPAGVSWRAVTVNINSPLISTYGLSDRDLREAGSKLMAVVEGELRRRGKR